MTKKHQDRDKLSHLVSLLDGLSPAARRRVASAWAEAYLARRTRHDPPPGTESNHAPRDAADQTGEGSCDSDSTDGVSQRPTRETP